MREGQLLRTALVLIAAGAAAFSAPPAATQTTTYTYDVNGRLTRVDYGGGRTVTYAYDAAGNTLREVSSTPDNLLFVAVNPAAGGSVTGSGIACPEDCSEAFSGTPQITLTAVAAGGFQFLGWAGDATGATNPFMLTMSGDRRAGCYFGASSGETDQDSLDDLIEMGPNGSDPSYDGNRDGVPDYQQSNVASLPTFDGQAYASLAVPAPLVLAAVSAVPNPSPGDTPAGASFPFGFFAFTIDGLAQGGCTTLDLFLPPSNLTSYYKHGPKPGDSTPQWYEFVHYHPALPGAEVYPRDGFVQVRLFLCDAQLGDDVAVADARIVDQGGPSGSLVAGIAVDPTSLTFASIASGSSTELTITVSSTGQDDLVIGSIATANPLATPFSITADACSGATLPAGAVCQLTVRFAPTAAGTFSDSFDVPSNDGAHPSVTVSLSGTATQAIAIPALGPLALATLVLLVALIGLAVIRRCLA